MRGRIIELEVTDKRGKAAKTIPLYQYDYGQKPLIKGVELPEYYEVHFSNQQYGDAITVLGDSTGVLIPDSLVATGETIYVWLFLHDTSYDGETEYMGAIPVIKRAQPTDVTPTPEEQSIITEVIAALNNMEDDMSAQVQAAESAKEAAQTAQTAAEGAATTASGYVDTVTAAQTAAEAAQAAAETAATSATASATSATSSANSANNALAEATNAKIAAVDAASAASTSATTATTASGNASNYATSAESAKVDAVAAQTAAEAAQTAAETAQGKAEDAQGAAETAQGKAEDAQTAAEAAQGKAEDAQEAAEDFAEDSEAYAVGTRNGVDVESDDPAYENNAKYYAEEAATVLEDKLDAPATAGTAGQVLTSDGEGGQAWADPSGAIDDTAGEGDTDKTWSADKLDEEFTDVLNDIQGMEDDVTSIKNELFEADKKSPYTTAANYRLNESDGLCTLNYDYKLVKYQVTAGDKVKVVSDDRFQFQTIASVPASGSNNRVGDTYGSGTFILVVPETATYLIVSTPTTSSADVYDFVSKIDEINDELLSAENDIEELKDSLIMVSGNLYNPALQTPQTISPHYFFAGEPYSSTQFDSIWNCTALIEIEPNTKYTVGLVPDIDGVTKPWNAAGAGGFFYDSQGNHINNEDFATNTFTSPMAAKYFRFNYQIINGFSLNELNARCMLVKGDTLPAVYEPYGTVTIPDKIEEIEKLKSVKPIWYKRTGTNVEVGYSYSNDKDIIVTFKKFGGNNLIDLYKAETISKGSDYGTATRTTLWENPSDCFSPYVVGAVNNIDGDETSQTFTGGQHQYNNQGSGSTPTARTTDVNVYADNKEVNDGGSGYADCLCVVWENRVQGYNTKKSDGTGREIIKVIHYAEFDGVDIKVRTDIYPLEDVSMYTFYGFQMYCGQTYPKVRYLGSANRLVNTIESGSSSSNSGDLKGYCYDASDGNGENMVSVGIDPLFDMGSREYATGQTAVFISSNKAYFSIVRNLTAMAEGSLYSLKGFYRFAYSKN